MTHETAPETTADQVRLGRPLDLIVLARWSNALECRIPTSSQELSLRPAVHDTVPGEIITVVPTKQWTYARRSCLAGRIVRTRLDVAALGLVPLQLRPEGDWDPEGDGYGKQDNLTQDWERAIRARGIRPDFEMEQVIPGEDPDHDDTDPIIEASELSQAGALGEARDLLMSLLYKDLRCLDAHAHLGNMEFPRRPHLALRHYAAGVGIASLALGIDFNGVLSWGWTDNRPYLRCLHGLGLCLWRLGILEEAEATFRRMLWLNPMDNQGARINLASVEAGQTWTE